MNNDISAAAKVMRDFKKDSENFSYFLGIMDNVVYKEEYINKISDLPSKQVLIGEILSLLNAPTASLALVLNQVTASLARVIKAVAEKNEG